MLVVGKLLPVRLCLPAADLDLGDLGAADAAVAGAHPLDDRAVARVASGAVGRLDQRPAQVVGAVLAQRPAAVALAGLVDAWGEAGVADQLAGTGEASDVTDLGGDRVAEHPGDARERRQQRDVGMVGAEPAQLALAGSDLLVELVDQRQARGDGQDHGSASSSRVRSARPPAPNRSRCGLAIPCWKRIAWTRVW